MTKIMKSQKKNIPVQKPVEKRKIDTLFEEYALSHQNATNKLLHWVGIPFIIFGIVGFLNTIPFPQLAFLGIYQTYINWFTIALGILGYYYYTLSPTLMWGMLLVFFGMQGLVIELEHWQKAGGLTVWQCSAIVFVLGWIIQFVGHQIEGKKPSFLKDIQFIFIGPLWLLHFIYQKIRIPY